MPRTDSSHIVGTPRGGASVVAVTWAAAAAAHGVVGLDGTGAGAAFAFTLAVVGAVGAAALLVRPRPELLVAAAVAGVVGVGAFALPLIVSVLGVGGPVADPVDPWGIGAFLVDALTVRLAVFTLRRAERSRPR